MVHPDYRKEITEEQFSKYILNSLFLSKSVACSDYQMSRIFGKPRFKRVDGMDFIFTKLFNPETTEEQMSWIFPTRRETELKIGQWAIDNNLVCFYDMNKDTWYFQSRKDTEEHNKHLLNNNSEK